MSDADPKRPAWDLNPTELIFQTGWSCPRLVFDVREPHHPALSFSHVTIEALTYDMDTRRWRDRVSMLTVPVNEMFSIWADARTRSLYGLSPSPEGGAR